MPAQLPPKVAAELLLTGRAIGAAEAHRLGLVNRVAPAGETLAHAVELAARVAAGAPLAVRAVKRLLRDGSWCDEPWRRVHAELEALFASADAREGAVAFTERRAARFVGR